MKVIAFDRFKAGVTMETIQSLLAEEVVMIESQFSDPALTGAALPPDRPAGLTSR